MEDPLNPLENQNPLDNTNPMDEPLLDALEYSIENPPGFVDPLAERDELLMDDLATQLDAVEAGIENTPSMPPEPGPREAGVDKDGDESDVQGEEPVTPEVAGPTENVESSEATVEQYGRFQGSPPRPQEGSAHMTPPNPPGLRRPHKGSSRTGRRKGPPRRRHTRGAGKLVISRQNTRYCPESHEIIYEQKCESCEKYRHWPEGTDEEPRECWYDWQARPPSDECDDDSDEWN
ncbi:MAG: hypothetical protein ACETWQ_07105 [Phycisphaerae bacterium]